MNKTGGGKGRHKRINRLRQPPATEKVKVALGAAQNRALIRLVSANGLDGEQDGKAVLGRGRQAPSDRPELVGERSDFEVTLAEELLDRNHGHVRAATAEGGETHRVEGLKGLEAVPVKGGVVRTSGVRVRWMWGAVWMHSSKVQAGACNGDCMQSLSGD